MILASSLPTRRGIEGPVRSMSRMPTDLPCRVRARASWRVTEDFPTPPLPDNTYTIVVSNCITNVNSRDSGVVGCSAVIDKRRGSDPRLTSTMFFTPSRGIACGNIYDLKV